MRKAEVQQPTIENLRQLLGAVMGLVSLMTASLPPHGDVHIHPIPKQFEPHCRAVYEALLALEPGLGSVMVEFVEHHMAPQTQRIMRCWYEEKAECGMRKSTIVNLQSRD